MNIIKTIRDVNIKNNAKQISSKFNSKTMATSKLDFDKNKMLANFKSSLKVNFKENKKDKVKFKQKSTLKQTHINKFMLILLQREIRVKNWTLKIKTNFT